MPSNTQLHFNKTQQQFVQISSIWVWWTVQNFISNNWYETHAHLIVLHFSIGDLSIINSEHYIQEAYGVWERDEIGALAFSY